jgi:hypothetical protein
MKRIPVIAATILAAACAGLASAQTPTITKVMVNTANPKSPLLWVDQEPIIVRGKKVKIEWQIATPGYEFATRGIEFLHRGQFVDCSGKGQSFECFDLNTVQGPFKYIINVRSTEKQPNPRPLDPTVMND